MIDYHMSDNEPETDDFNDLNTYQNRKKKKAGGWQAMGLDHAVFKGILKKGYRQPTPIQRKAIPRICCGSDVVAMSRTGSGKTAAFVVPMLQKLKKRDLCGIRAIILSPTRELALQSFKFVKELGKYTGLLCACLIGGDSMDEQFAVLHQHPDIVIATPGRLLHVVVEMGLKLTSVKYVVFDEADRLFEIGLAEQLKEIIKRLPESRQTLLFSATLPKILVEFAKAGLSDPVLVRLDVESKLSDKLQTVFACCRASEKFPALIYLCRALNRERRKTIVFCATMKHVELLVAMLREADIEPAFLYSQLDPVARKQNIYRFRTEADCSLLVVTDIAARGVDIPLLDFAVNWHFPSRPKLFVHRVGRVARAGKAGVSISLVSPDEMAYVLDVFLFIGKPLTFVDRFSTQNIWDVDASSTSSGLIGRLPDTLSHMEAEFLDNIQQNSIEIKDLQQKADNAMKKYTRTRMQASAESIRRVKTELQQISPPGIHPFFFAKNFFPELASDQKTDQLENSKTKLLLQQLHNWRPNQAIFSVQNTLGGRGKIKTQNQEQILAKENRLERLKAEEKAAHFVDYLPTDANTESGLSLQQYETNIGGFEAMAKLASLDLSADDEKGLYMAGKASKTVWDRKRKRFVSAQSGQPQVKRIRTEEGSRLPVTYKSGRYERWKSRQNVDFQNGEEDEEDGGGNERRKGGRRGFGRHKNGGGNNSAKSSNASKNSKFQKSWPKSELKNTDQIMKSRRKKASVQAYQSHRRQENLKKKGGRSSNVASGRAKGLKGRGATKSMKRKKGRSGRV